MTTWTGKKKDGEELEQGVVRQGLSRMGTWTGLAGKKDEQVAETNVLEAPRKGKKNREEDQDDRRIRFTIGGAGKRMTKEDFLKEIQSLDPKTRARVVNESTAPEEVKDLARKDASPNIGGSSRLYAAKDPKLGSSPRETVQVAAGMAKEKGGRVKDEDVDSETSVDEANTKGKCEESANATNAVTAASRREDVDSQVFQDESPASTPQTSIPTSPNLSTAEMPSQQVPETAAERRRRENVLRGLGDEIVPRSSQQLRQRSQEERPNIIQQDLPYRSQQERSARETPAERRRREATNAALLSSTDMDRGRSPTRETPAEKRRREAALGVGGDVADSDSDDDNTERVPQARRRPGIRFAEEPIRGRK
jgi:sodium/hydrogen antiporter